MNRSISGLIVRLNMGRSIYLTRSAPFATVVEVTLLAIDLKQATATLAVTAGGERCDLALLAIVSPTSTVMVSADQPAEVVPGVTVAIRANPRQPFITTTGASLIIDADRQDWVIERDEVAERNIRKRSRFLKAPSADDPR